MKWFKWLMCLFLLASVFGCSPETTVETEAEMEELIPDEEEELQMEAEAMREGVE